MSYYHLFVKNRCPHCKEAVKVLKENKFEHVVSSMDKAPSALSKLKEGTSHNTVPIIFEVDNENRYSFVGGCDDLKRSFENEDTTSDTEENPANPPEEVQEQAHD